MSEASETQSAFARRLGITRQSVAGLVRRGMPIGEHGKINVDEALIWVKANIVSRRNGANRSGLAADDETPISLTEARRLKIMADTELKNLLIDRERGTLVLRTEVHKGLASFARLQRDKWVNFPNRFGSQIAAEIGADPRAVMTTLDKFVRDQLAEIANIKPTVP